MAKYERSFLVPYLQDVCTSEMICFDFVKKIKQIDTDISKLQNSISNKIPKPIIPSKKAFSFSDLLSILHFLFLGLVCALGFLGISIIPAVFLSLLFGEGIYYLLFALCVSIIVVATLSQIINGSSERKESNEYQSKEYQKNLAQYRFYQDNLPKWSTQLSKLQTKKKHLQAQQAKAEQIKKNVYSINIIPSKYRNIYIAYYLYDFFSTSRSDDLDVVLQTLLLDEIRKNTATLIVQNQEQIILKRKQIALQESQNAMLSAQHEERLEHMIQIEENQERQLDYQKMIEVNQEVTNFLIAADFYRNTKE